MKKLIFALMAALIATPVFADPPGESTAYDNWVVGCDNGDNCRAVAILGGLAEFNEGPSLSFDRAGGAAGMMGQLNFDQGQVEGDIDHAAGVDIDGQRYWPENIRNASEPGNAPFSDSAEYRRVIPVDIEMMRAMAEGEILTIIDLAGKPLGRYPLTGFKYAMRYVDAKQWRDGTVTAVVAKGDDPADYVVSGSEYPKISIPFPEAAPPKDKMGATEAREWQKRFYCYEDESSAPDGPRRLDHYRLDDQHTLVLLSCTFGAYQSSDAALVLSGKDASLARFDITTLVWDDIPVPLVTSADFDPTKGILSGFAKGRGLGDCGVTYQWLWVPQDGMFRLISWDEMPECRGVNDWIRRWKAEIQ